MDEVKQQREWLKSTFPEWYQTETDQKKQLPQPPLFKAAGPGQAVIDLPVVSPEVISQASLWDVLQHRQSRREYTSDNLTLAELSFLLWATQGVQKVSGNSFTKRTVPSGGSRHPFETYLAISRVEGLPPGLYRYLPQSHGLVSLQPDPDLAARLTALTLGQNFVGKAAVTFIWSCLPYRGEWRYHRSAHKVILLEAGHVCAHLYLAGEAIGCGVCAIGSYDQAALDRYLGVDGTDELAVYLAAVGKAAL